jgi:hypothetical protein
MIVFKALRAVGRRMPLPARVVRHLNNIGFYEYTLRGLDPTLPPVSLRAALGMAEVWPAQGTAHHSDVEDGTDRISRPRTTAAH